MKIKIVLLASLLLIVSIILVGCQKQPELPKQPAQPKIDHLNETQNQTNQTLCEPEILFSDDFESYGEGSLASENWYLAELSDVDVSRYNVKNLDGNKAMWLKLRGAGIVTDALLIKKNFDNFSLEFSLHDNKPYSTVPAIVLRFDENGNYYLVLYKEYGNVVAYKMPEKKTIFNNKISITTLQDGKWHKFKIIANGTKIEGWIDDLVKAFEINDNSIEKGKIGFANSDGSLGEYFIDDVKIESLC